MCLSLGGVGCTFRAACLGNGCVVQIDVPGGTVPEVPDVTATPTQIVPTSTVIPGGATPTAENSTPVPPDVTASPLPTLGPLPTLNRQTICNVTGSFYRVRDRPALSGLIIDELAPGDCVEADNPAVIADDGTIAWVQIFIDGEVGWTASNAFDLR